MERPWLFRGIRVIEALGLLAVFYGLASSQWLTAVVGAGVIMVSYQFYRTRFTVISNDDDGSMGMSDGGD